jgi:hypothetical protein
MEMQLREPRGAIDPRLTESEEREVLRRMDADFARLFGAGGLPECRCCMPDPATEERIQRLRSAT